MKKQEEEQQEEIYEIDDFEENCHLWNIVPGGQGKGIVLLRTIIDSIQNNNHKNAHKKLPSLLLVGKTGSGKKLVARALVNSLVVEDVRECPGQFFHDNIPSVQFFQNSVRDTAHIIYNIEKISKIGESVLWRYLKMRECGYYNYTTRSFDWILHCNGLIVMTTTELDKLSTSILDVIDYIVELEPYSPEQIKLIVHQMLKIFCRIEYEGEQVLQEIVKQGQGKIGQVIDFLKICLMTLKAEMRDYLDMEIVEKAKRLGGSPVPPAPLIDDDIRV